MRHHNWILLALVAIAGLLVLTPSRIGWALAGKLDRPSIAIPTVGEAPAGKPEPICSAMQDTLAEHAKQFVSGRFINAHSTMEFKGTTAELNAFLKDLAVINGAKLQIRFATSSDDPLHVINKAAEGPLPYQWRIEHNAWGDAQYLSVTIFVGDGKIKIEDVQIPMIVGQTPATTSRNDILAPVSAEKQP